MCKKYLFTSGSNCTWDMPLNNCLNQCNQRGKCVAGWCHCSKGFYGMDCSLSLGVDGQPQLLAGSNYTLRKKRPSIYVYELPPKFNAWYNIRQSDRPLAFMLHQRLLSAGARTADGDSADYFFIPMTIRGPSESMWLVDAISYIRKTWPWWDKFGGGSRHLVVHTGDVGRMDAAGTARDLAENATWLTHWGLYEDYPFSGWKKAHRPGIDIVVPIHISPHSPRARPLHHSPLHPLHPERRGMQESVSKNLEVLFAGRICGGREEPVAAWPNCPKGINKGYSQGVRQLVHYHHWNRTGFSIMVSNKHYMRDLAHSRFCLAPTGGGHGHRQILVAFSGCVPLLIGDSVHQPFEPELDWSAFSVSVPQAKIPELHDVLGAVDEEAFAGLQRALHCGAQHMTYTSFLGSFQWDDGKYDAFETIMEILRARLDHPGVEPERLASVDEDFKAFMECRSPGEPEWQPPTQLPPNLCTISAFDEEEHPKEACQPCFQRNNGVIPGGASCCKAASLAECPRAWE